MMPAQCQFKPDPAHPTQQFARGVRTSGHDQVRSLSIHVFQRQNPGSGQFAIDLASDQKLTRLVLGAVPQRLPCQREICFSLQRI